jgi:hypothetical protein
MTVNIEDVYKSVQGRTLNYEYKVIGGEIGEN